MKASSTGPDSIKPDAGVCVDRAYIKVDQISPLLDSASIKEAIE